MAVRRACPSWAGSGMGEGLGSGWASGTRGETQGRIPPRGQLCHRSLAGGLRMPWRGFAMVSCHTSQQEGGDEAGQGGSCGSRSVIEGFPRASGHPSDRRGSLSLAGSSYRSSTSSPRKVFSAQGGKRF